MSNSCYGLLADFSSADDLLAAVRMARRDGYRQLEAYTPFSVEGLPEALALSPNRVPMISLIGGVLGGVGAFALQWYSAVVDFPINSGGRPLNSWPAFIPVTFEVTVLGAALATFFGMLALNGLPNLRHALFEVPEFDLASRNRFFLCVRSSDALFSESSTRAWLDKLHPVRVLTVPAAR